MGSSLKFSFAAFLEGRGLGVLGSQGRTLCPGGRTPGDQPSKSPTSSMRSTTCTGAVSKTSPILVQASHRPDRRRASPRPAERSRQRPLLQIHCLFPRQLPVKASIAPPGYVVGM
jgi:hypothetical protein